MQGRWNRVKLNSFMLCCKINSCGLLTECSHANIFANDIFTSVVKLESTKTCLLQMQIRNISRDTFLKMKFIRETSFAATFPDK